MVIDLPKEEDQDKIDEEYRRRFGYQLDDFERNPIYRETIRLWMTDYLRMAKLLEEQVGYEKAIELVRKHRAETGTEIGKRYKKQAEEKGITNPILALLEGYKGDWAITQPYTWIELYPNAKNPTKMIFRLKCYVGDNWKTSGDPKDLEYGAALCDTDYTISRAIHPKLKAERPRTMWRGDKYCEWVWTLDQVKS